MKAKVLIPEYAAKYVTDDFKKHKIEIKTTSSTQSEDELLAKGKDVSGAMILMPPDGFNQNMIDQMPNLKVISRLGVGYDNVDYHYAAKKGIVVTNTPGANAISVAESTVCDMLILAKHSYSISKAMRDGDNDYISKHPTSELAHKTVGIVGYGHIGQAVAKMLSGFGVKILIWNRHQKQSQYGKFVDWNTLFQQSDYISLHIPSTSETIHSVSRKEFKMMKKSAMIVNFARGSVIDEKAMINALKTGEIAGAGLDVFEKEPLPMDSELRKLPNVYMTPHISAQTTEAIEQTAINAASEMIRVIEGQRAKWQVN
ncbi:3-phosphoglycerate dehydrogenase [Philodulcilactobacillus myokoensis]|uniref:3-phosphoglycerate dehydrogenase n=1 Tax=Philodulcilactobacillus myokoensis TaxID=2929573 RepID=A0A9W6B177_9LACO|nr:phosphoglycerate dehydrogenase [Philodulcilactobacillus myokoensis]GLB46513.1 3-phosphoglycerate dehydrogenase [Philodulcilactobacillus myokoensis]